MWRARRHTGGEGCQSEERDRFREAPAARTEVRARIRQTCGAITRHRSPLHPLERARLELTEADRAPRGWMASRRAFAWQCEPGRCKDQRVRRQGDLQSHSVDLPSLFATEWLSLRGTSSVRSPRSRWRELTRERGAHAVYRASPSLEREPRSSAWMCRRLAGRAAPSQRRASVAEPGGGCARLRLPGAPAPSPGHAEAPPRESHASRGGKPRQPRGLPLRGSTVDGQIPSTELHPAEDSWPRDRRRRERASRSTEWATGRGRFDAHTGTASTR